MGETEDIDAFVVAGVKLIGIDIRPEWLPAISAHLAISLAHARTVGEFELPDEIDPAPVFAT